MEKNQSARAGLTARDSGMPTKCPSCQSVGTIVDLGACCRVAGLVQVDKVTELFHTTYTKHQRHYRLTGH